MSDGRDQKARDEEYIGYGHPPKSHRFKKGQSGNPGGRPRRHPSISVGELTQSQYDKMTLEEMARFAVIREGGNSEKVQLDRAAIRALNHKAAKGDLPAFKEISKRRDRIEQRLATEWEATLRAVFEYKEHAHQQIRLNKKLRNGAREIVPHPDDIQLDFVNRRIVFNGPVTFEQKMAQDFFVANYDELVGEALRLEMGPGDPGVAQHLQRMRRQGDTVIRLVRARASTTNSWTSATLEEKTDFLRRHVWPDYSTKLSLPVADSDVWFRVFMRRFLKTEWTDEDETELRNAVRKAFSTFQGNGDATTPRKTRSRVTQKVG